MLFAFASAFLLFTIPALATTVSELKQLSLESLSTVRVNTVTAASRHEQKLSDAPANVTVVTGEEFKLYGWRKLGDALKSVGGMVVSYDRAYGFVGLRGFNRPGDYSGRMLMTVNGHRLNDAIYDTSAVDRDFVLDVDNIERVEIIRGPGSTLYGNNAFFGIINIVTRRGADLKGSEISGSYGTFDSYTGRLNYGNKFTNGVELMLSGSLFGTEGDSSLRYPEFSEFNNGVAKDMDDGRSRHAFGQIAWKSLSLEIGYVDRYKRVPSAAYWMEDAPVIFNDPTFRMFDERAYANLKLEHEFADEWKLMSRVYYDYYHFDGRYPYDYEPANPLNPRVMNVDVNRSQSIGAEFQLSRLFWEKHLITVGAEARYDFEIKLLNFDESPRELYVDADRYGYFAGGFIQDEFHVLPNLTLTAGGRFDHYHVGGDTVNPRAALVYHPWKPSTFKLLYGEAYRAPNGYENYYDWPTPPSDLGLKPETVRSYELIYEHEFNSVWRATAAIFRNELENLITDGEAGYENLDRVVAQGFETELRALWEAGLQLRASYSFSSARDESTDEKIANAPAHLAKLNASVPVWRNRLFAAAEIQAMSDRNALDGNRVSGFWIANASLLSRELLPGLELSLSVYNLFDRRYSDPTSPDFLQRAIPQDGRSLRVKATWRF